MPLIVTLGVLSRDLVLILMGRQWLESAYIFRILAFAAFWQPVVSTVGWVYVSLNRTRRFALWGLMSSSIIILSFCIGLPWGARGVALGYSVCMWLIAYPAFRYALRDTPVPVGSVIDTLRRPVLLSVVIGACLYLVRLATEGMAMFWAITASGVCAVLVILFMFRMWKGIREDVEAIAQLGKSIFHVGAVGTPL